METSLPPNYIGKKEMRPCSLKDHPSNAVKKVGEGANSREPINFQKYIDITHVEALLLTKMLQITCFVYMISIWKAMW
jgi:hypothetical protein